MSNQNPFKWRHYEADIILLYVRWYLRYSLSYRDIEEMMLERGLKVDHTTIYRWVQRYAPELERRCKPHTTTPRAITVDKNGAYPKAFKELKAEGIIPEACELRQIKYLNNIVEQDHRFIKRLVKPGMGFFSWETAWQTLQGYAHDEYVQERSDARGEQRR